MTSKQCNKCKVLKPLSEFSKAKSFNDGHRYQCKFCDKVDRMSYRHTKAGLIKGIYLSQKYCSKHRGHPLPDYSVCKLIDWFLRQPHFDALYLNWMNSGYSKWKTPSVDRIDDYKSYSLDNIQLMTWGDNNKKANNDVKIGKNNKRSKAVSKFSYLGVFLEKYYSISEAARQNNIKPQYISRCCMNKKYRKLCMGYAWKYS